MTAADATPSPAPRLSLVDVARGGAIAAMLVYHFTWDLWFFELTTLDAARQPAWRAFAHAIAASFLLLVGIGLELGHGRRLDLDRFLRRLAIVAGAAALITLATWLALPEGFVFFGILHCIALSSVLALPLLRLPALAALVAAVAVFAVGLLVSDPLFDRALLVWLGLGTVPPRTNDYVPIFPWFGFVLIGLGLARLGLAVKLNAIAPDGGAAARWLARAGRWSLPIYLIHQPIFFGVLTIAAALLAPGGDAETRIFVESCARSCVTATGRAQSCEAYCRCTAADLKNEGLWTSAIADRFTPADRVRLEVIQRRCIAGP